MTELIDDFNNINNIEDIRAMQCYQGYSIQTEVSSIIEPISSHKMTTFNGSGANSFNRKGSSPSKHSITPKMTSSFVGLKGAFTSAFG
jgi:hypothetical protein